MIYCRYCTKLLVNGKICPTCGAQYAVVIVHGPTKDFDKPVTIRETYDKKGNRVRLD